MNFNYLKSIYAKSVLLALFFSTQGQAQSAYTVESIPYQVYAASSPFQATTDDHYSTIFTIPFDFTFFENTYNKFVVSTNGYIDFRTELANISSPFSFQGTIPNANFPVKNSILGCFHDMSNTSGLGTITWTISGNAPYRQFVLMFNNQPHYSCGVSKLSSFQIIIYETLNYIDVQVTRKDLCSQWLNGNAVIGIINDTGLSAYSPPGRNTGAWTVTTGEGWRFKPQTSSSYKYIKCDANTDGIEIFDLAVAQADLDPSAIFYVTQQDAEQATNPITQLQYTNTIPFQQSTVYATYNGLIVPVLLSMVDCNLGFDLDNVDTALEDVNNDGNLANDDTDGDGIPNFVDNDDDGDLIPTSEEYVFENGGRTKTNNNGTPLDTDGDGIPNYLDNDDDGDGILTKDEDYNHNGNPADDDVNNNGIPDYLENSNTARTLDNSIKNRITLYPNPSSNILNIENNSGKDISDITIYSVNGIKVKQSTNSDSMHISDLQSGIYIVKIQIDNEVINYKFIKK